MGREEKEQVLILKTYRVGENHRGVKLLTPVNGVVTALVYGGQGKNGLKKGAIIPFCYGQGELVHDRSRGRYQLKEFDAEMGFDGIRADLGKTYRASLWAEILLGSYGGGQGGVDLFSLMLEGLHYLDGAEDEGEADRVMIRFLWSYLGLSGERPDPRTCHHCGAPLGGDIYRDDRGFLYGSRCGSSAMGRLPQSLGVYLDRADHSEWSDFLQIGLPRESREGIKGWLYALVQDHMGFPLKTLRTGSFLL